MDRAVLSKTPGHPDEEPLALRLRTRRQELKLTLKQVADRTGLSVGFISQIERGITMPSITSLIGVARVLGVHVSDFLAQPKATATTRHDQRLHYAVGSSSVMYERLSASFPGNVLRSVLIHEPPGYRSEPIAHEGEEMFFMINGSITVEVEGERFVLEAGDSLHFASTRIHSTWNHTTQPATVLHVCTMDVFGDEPAIDAGTLEVRRGGTIAKPQSSTKAKKTKGNVSQISNEELCRNITCGHRAFAFAGRSGGC